MKARQTCLLLLVLLPLAASLCNDTVCGVGGTCSAPTTCTSCGTLSALPSFLYSDDHCYINCPANSTKNTNTNTCDTCSSSCNGCSGSTTSCLACASSYYRVIGSSQCTNDCGDGYYGNTNTQSCTACPQGCTICSMVSTAVQCTNCGSVAGTQYYLSVKACISVCPSGQFGDSGGTIPTCSSCTGDCATCRGSSTTCLSCSTGALGYGENVCYTNCPDGSYNPGTNFCKLCPGQCLTCSNLTACSSCGIEGGLQTYLHTDFNCYSTCPNDYYGGKDVSNNFVCLACDGSCNGCQSSSTNCLQCENSTFFRKIGSSLCTSACGTGLYGNPNTGLCTYCPVGCSACSYTTQVQCSACLTVAGVVYYLNNGKYCVSQCPLTSGGAGQYKAANGTCATCEATCQTCNGANNNDCLTCVSGKVLSYGFATCLSACPDGQYAPSGSQTCLPCSVNCLTCSTNSSHCDSCTLSVNGLALFLLSSSNTCLSSCPIGKFGNTTTSICDPCHSSCRTCVGPLETDCLSCSSGSFDITNTTCVSSCGAGRYNSNSICYACPDRCSTCTSVATCTACQKVLGVPYFLNLTSCLVQCPSGTYGDTTSLQCIDCTSPCATCSGSATYCLTCIASNYLVYGSYICQSACPTGQYIINNTYTCGMCSAQCVTCDLTATNCTSCGLGNTGIDLFLSGNLCYQTCPSGYFGNTTTHLCDACDGTCNGCTLSAVNCILCAAGKYRQVGSNQCNSCPTGYYGDNSTTLCTPCSVGCVQCTSASVCSKCTQIAGVNYYLNATACLSICPTGTLGITDGSGDLVCTVCTGPCATCSGAITYCLSCTSGNVLYYTEATCSAHCPDGEYDGGSGACKPCAIYCKTCSSSALDCQSCKSLGGVGYYLSGTSCLISCPEGTFKNSSALTCDVCPSGCPSCFGPTLADCYSCTSNATDTYYLVYGTSTCGACPDGQYAVNATMKCMLCASTCLTCSVTSTSCLTCSFSSLLGAHLYLSGNQCLMSCPTGYWGNVTDHKCTACHVGCAACTDDTITSCTVCANASGTLYYKHIGETVCNTTCPDGQFISASIPFLCQKCGSTCVTCSSTADNCTSSSCAANLYYLSNSCLAACPTGYYADSSKQCQLCAAGCYSCFGASASSCSKCLTLANTTVYYLKDLSTCSQSCDPGYYGNDTLHLCVACSSACKTCTSPTVCQSCQSVNGVGYFLNATACLVLCPLGTYGRVTDYTCQICATGCLSCFGAAVTQCFNCTGDYQLIYGTSYCNLSCPDGQYQNTTSHQCLLCSASCLTCNNTSTECLTCGLSNAGVPLFLHVTTCLAACPASYFGNTTDSSCDACHQGCSTCLGANLEQCLTCANVSGTIYYKHIGENICNTTCPDGQFISASVPFLCQKCSSTCVSCSNTAENCTSSNCSINFYFLDNSCLSKCPDNYYTDTSLRQCLQCTDGCQSCYASGLTSCTKCKIHANSTYYYLQYLTPTTCAPACSSNEYKDNSTLQCKPCPFACLTCLDASTCSSCTSVNGLAYFLNGTICTAKCPADQYGQVSNYTCTLCWAGCATCYGSSWVDCYSCKANGTDDYYLIYGTDICNLTCPDGQYQNITNHQCLICSLGCLTCNYNSTYCTSCGLSQNGLQLYLQNGQCLADCTPGNYENTTNNLCTACDPACLTCLDSTRNYCLKCGNVSTTQYYLTVGDTICSTSCPLGQYIDLAYPNNCRLCSDNCVGCQGTSGNCTLTDGCKANQYFNNATNSCVLVCPDGTFPNVVSRFCENCSLGCELCYGAAVSKCTRCRNETDPLNASLTVPYFRQLNKDLCVSACATGEYGDVSTLLCQKCSPACAVCTSSAYNCSTCQSVNGVAYYLQGLSCLVACPIGKYGLLSTFTCMPCSAYCFSCYGDQPTQCFTCTQYNSTDYFLNYNTDYCGSSCPNGQYANSTSHQCLLCSGSCKTCFGTATNCTSCGFSQYGFNLYLYGNQCLLNCPSGYWSNSTGNTCDKCTEGCSVCYGDGITQCSKCKNDSVTPSIVYYKYIGADVCNTSCPGGQFIAASVPNYCQPCSPVCVTCSNTAQNCTNLNCSVNYFYLNNSCLAACPDNYYTDSSLRQCLQCSPGCQTCFGPGLDACSKCNSLANGTQYFLQIDNTTCGPTCNSGEFPYGFTGKCTLCNPVCATCTSSTLCQTCQSVNGIAYYLSGSSCIIGCPAGQFGQLTNFTCLQCPTGCATCFGSTNLQCYSCGYDLGTTTHFYLEYGTNYCGSSCPNGQYANLTSHTCLPCSPECKTCFGTATNCTSCGFSQYGFDLYLYGYQCLINCPISYWQNITQHTCDLCSQGCLECTDLGIDKCSKCKNDSVTPSIVYYKHIGADVCNTSCPGGQFIAASVPNYCQPCSPVCITCENAAENCTNLNCSVNYFYLNNSCLAACPDNYYTDSSLRQCLQCSPGCQTCFGPGLDACSKCNSLANGTQYFLQIGKNACSAGCNPGEFAYNLTTKCTVCNEVCATCTSYSVCQSCQSLHGVAYFLSQQSCIYACPSSQYGRLADLTCYDCPAGCLSCFGGSPTECYNCTTANNITYLLVYGTNYCSVECPPGQFANASSWKCLLCDANCLTCLGTSTHCLSCGFSSIGASLYLYNSGCLLSCPSGYFSNNTTSVCDPCHQGCSLCYGSSSSECTACRTANISNVMTPYYKQVGENNCSQVCPTGQLASGKLPNTCSLCDPGCGSCSGLSTNCGVGDCNAGYYYHGVNSSCLSGCPDNYYPNSSTYWCTQCAAGCQLCSGWGTDACSKCQISANISYYKVIDVNTCTQDCPPGQYEYPLLLTCKYCAASCLTCNSSGIDCQTCTNVSGVPYFNLNNQCLLSCPDRYYGQTTSNICQGCLGGCALCFGGTNTSCTKCEDYNNQTFYLVYGSTNCSLTCPAGQYQVPFQHACLLCDPNCYTCVGLSTNCTSCFLTSTGIRLFLQNQLCVQTCATATYSNSSDNTCYACQPGCLACTGPSLNECQACRDVVDSVNSSIVTHYYLNIGNTICSLLCPLGQFVRDGYPNVCQPCAVQCVGCSVLSTNCTESPLCTLGYYFYRATNSCITACPGGYYANSTTRYCEPCPGGCALCKTGSLNNCQQCKQDPSSLDYYYKEIYRDSCVLACDNGEYEVASDFSCQPCQSSCLLCQDNSTACQICTNVSGISYYYHSNECLLACPDGLYGQKTNNTCVGCHQACPLCFGPSTEQCYSCRAVNTTYYYLSYATTYCVTECPYGQYAVNASYSCQPCNINCATCSGTSTSCLTCTYVNTINIVYLYLNKCVVTCPGGLWANSTAPLDHQCSPCHAYCTVCTGPTNVQCTGCNNQTSPFVIYYKDRYSTTCNPDCPVGQYIDAIIPNLCVPCDPKCLVCSNSSSNCTRCALGYYLYESTLTCTALCPSGFFNNNTLTANNYYCSLCLSGCLTCNGPGLDHCQTCQTANVSGTLVYYFKEVSLDACVTRCSTGYFGNTLNNKCDPCQAGCISCEFNASYCYSCRAANGNDFFKPQTSNSCLIVCPNGEYGNITDHQCHDCIYYTLSGSCVLTCPSDYFPQLNGTKTICQSCSDPSAVGNPCNRSYTFQVQTEVTNGGNNLQHKIYLPNGLSSSVTVQQLMTNLSVVIKQPSRRRLTGTEERLLEEIPSKGQRMLFRGRLLSLSTPLTVQSLRISSDRTVIYIVTNYASADFSVAQVVIDFPATALIAADGLLYQSTTASYALSDPIFQQTLFQVFSMNFNLEIEGIIFILLSVLLLVFQLVIANRKGYHQMMAFIMLLQVMGLSRIRQYPINFNIYSILKGYSYFQLPFLPNVFKMIFPAGYKQNSLEPVAFALGSQNSILNLGGIIELYFGLQLVLAIYYVLRNDRPEHVARMKLFQETLVVLFMVVILYDSALSLMSLSLNSITNLVAQYLGGVVLALLLLIFYLIYVLVWVRPYRLFELYKVNNIFRVVGLAILPLNRYGGLILIDIAELIFFLVDMVLYRSEKLNAKTYVLERVLIVVALNGSIFADTSISLLGLAGVGMGGILLIKIYYTVITVKEYIDLGRIQGASEVDVSDIVNVSDKAKDDFSMHIDSKSFIHSKINQSENFIYNESLDIEKFDESPSKHQFIDPRRHSSRREEESEEEEEKKSEEEPREAESEESNEQMIVYLDPDDYKEDARKKQEIKKISPDPRPTTQGRGRRQQPRMDGMRTSAGFYPRERVPHHQTMDEGIEVIKVEPNREEGEESSDLVSDSSDGAGWLAQNDQRNMDRARKNRLVWKIVEEDPFTKDK